MRRPGLGYFVGEEQEKKGKKEGKETGQPKQKTGYGVRTTDVGHKRKNGRNEEARERKEKRKGKLRGTMEGTGH